jgi:hypothetical protein
MGGACSTNVRDEKMLVGKPEGERSLGQPRHRWKGNIRMDLADC